MKYLPVLILSCLLSTHAVAEGELDQLNPIVADDKWVRSELSHEFRLTEHWMIGFRWSLHWSEEISTRSVTNVNLDGLTATLTYHF